MIPSFSQHFSLTGFRNLVAATVLAGVAWSGPSSANPIYTMSDFESSPIVINENTTTPMVMLNASNDHQLFFKAYNDYSDLDDDGIPDTTYDHSIDYYGYFDSYKCYVYDIDEQRFEPNEVSSDKYCNGPEDSDPDDQWSGNFLNWASMSRIDTIRKILFGGHRRVDESNGETVLERAYLPHDAHSWAKHYAGDDIPKLVPFTPAEDVSAIETTEYWCDQSDDTGCEVGGVLDRQRIGITIGNTTDVDASLYGSNTFSEKFTDPPLIKVVRGNHSLWASNERWQVTWRSGADYDNHSASNGNDPATSGIYAYSDNPIFSEGLGEKNYVARVLACVNSLDANGQSLIGEERCKLYPGADQTYGLNRQDMTTVIDATSAADDVVKPIGLLQVYGDDDEMNFGMIAGSYLKHTAGGVLIRNIGSMSNEINVDTDGTFTAVAEFAGGPQGNNSSGALGLINAWSLYRIVGYDIDDGTYRDGQGDNCNWGLSEFSDVDGNRCKNWGNPFSEIYYQSINYFSGGGVIGDYRSNSSTGIPGLPVPQNFTDPLNHDNRCAKLSVINLNSSVFSYDYDELDSQSYGPHTVWDEAVLPGTKDTTDMTNYVGDLAGLYETGSNSYFIGEATIGASTEDQLCTPKNLVELGSAGGICPEAPRLRGSYRIAGLAYYAHVEDIRPENATGNRDLESDQNIDTYSVALAANVPVLKIADPNDQDTILATIIPACRNQELNPEGNCAIVDYKIVEQEIDETNKTVTGTLYINWEDSEQGGDYDQDMWGTLSYELDAGAGTLSITTDVHSESTNYTMGFGYVVSGTNDDGFQAHSGIWGFTYPATVVSGISCDSGCQEGDAPSTKNYKLGDSTAELLKDPLWYASKYGGFEDSNFNNQPDLVEEWDRKINATGEDGSDGIPDTYYYAENPRQLEDSLKAALDSILERTSSGTAAAVVSSNVRGEGALFQAYFKPRITDENDQSVSWVGTVQALWLDRFGLSRQDCSPPRGYDATEDKCVPPTGPCIPNQQLDNYCVDQVVETFYDEGEERTKMRIYQSSDPHLFEAFAMEGVVSGYSSGILTMAPNSLEGTAAFDGPTNTLTISPYTVSGTVTAYDAATGDATIAISGWSGPSGETFDSWNITSSAGPGVGFSDSAISLATSGGVPVTISPSGTWINIGDVLTFSTHGVVGETGRKYSTWVLECLNPAGTTYDIFGAAVKLQNSEDVPLYVDPLVVDFSTCTRAKISTYNIRGDEGESYSNWEVANLNTQIGRGTSTTTMELSNTGEKIITVEPTSAWLEPGDRVLVSNYTATSSEINNISYLWNAREGLYLDGMTDPNLELLNNRSYTTKTETADTGRFIKTWVDLDLDGVVDAGEYRDFVDTMFDDPTNQVPHGFFDVADIDEAKDTVNYIRGIEIAGTRDRTIKFDPNDTSENVMRLGDMINSTPSVVPAPQEAFDLLYNDNSYGEFRRKYINRRIMVYTGGNDGLLHAFNSGFYTVADEDGNTLTQYGQVLAPDCSNLGSAETFNTDGFVPATVKYTKCGFDAVDDSAAAPHPLGSEVWAYAPMNLLPHLQWLKDPDYQYSHVYFVDGKPRIFDAKIFPTSATHPNGWGTIMVVGMSLGGGLMNVDVNSDDTGGGGNTGENLDLRSAYMVFDITNPEEEPNLLGEIPMPDYSFSTVYPAVVTFQDTTGTNCNGGTAACNRWYLQFGTGPNDLTTYTSDQNTKMFMFDLKQFIDHQPSPVATASVPGGCSVDTAYHSTYNIISCDTGVGNSFMGTPVVADWDLDYFADTSYFGVVGDPNDSTGKIIRMYYGNTENPSSWDSMHTMYTTDRPITVQPAPGIDNHDNKWIYFGTGRYFANADKTTTLEHSLYGIKDYETGTEVPSALILDTTDAEVFADGTMQASIKAVDTTTDLASFEDIEDEIDDNASGWKMDLPPIVTTNTAATRNLTRSALFGGVLFTTVFQPSSDPCEGEGNSRLYALFYKTGTAFPSPSVLGATIVEDGGEIKYLSKKYLDLGTGFATSPAIHSGSGKGGDEVRVLTQLSTGDIVTNPAQPVFNVRTGRTAWGEN